MANHGPLGSLYPSFVYRTYRIDTQSSTFPFLVGKYAALSLRALNTDPGSFGVAYSTEAALGPADFESRLLRPNVNVFVCVAHESNAAVQEQCIERGSWVGMVTQIGPTPKDTFWLPSSGAPEPQDDAVESKWHQTALWTDSAHRGKGIATQMIETAIGFAISSSPPNVSQVRIRAFTGPDNQASLALYGRSGVVPVGKCTIPEAMLANGNSAYLFHGRDDWPDEIMYARIGLIMEKVAKMHPNATEMSLPQAL